MSKQKHTTQQKKVFDALVRKKPMFHGREKAGSQSYPLQKDVLAWILNTIPGEAATLETGCGYSTVVFALKSKRHSVISPFSEEHRAIASWCRENQISTDHIDFIPKISQEALPEQFDGPPLDLVLIDGDHAFPAPFIDWYYTADRLVCGGFILVDDTQLSTGRILKDFLLGETHHWQMEVEIGKTVIFKKIVSTPVARGIPWTHQTFVNPDYRG